MHRSRWRSTVAFWTGLAIIGLGLVGALLVSTAAYDPLNGTSEVVAFELWLTVVTVVIGLVIVVTWGAHRWGSSRRLSEELGVVPPRYREEPWLKDVIDRRGPPPGS